MINVMVRERKKVKGLSGSRKAATFYNGKSAAKSLLEEKRSTNRGGTSLISLPSKFLYSIMGMVETESDLTMEKTGLVYQIKNLENSSEIALELGWSSEAVLRKINNGTYSVSPLPKECYPIRSVDSRKGRKSAQR
jgi:hypothetical protein